MPRTKVAPGSCSKRSCSSASSWRCANFRRCATSASASPCSSRARASSAPMPGATAASAAVSVILAFLQRLEFRRSRVAAAQLVGVALLRDALAQAALDAQRKPERLGVRRHQLVVARDQLARLVHVALAVADLAHLEERGRLVGLDLQRALEELLGLLQVVRVG